MDEDDDRRQERRRRPTIKVVGPCKAGKTTLVAGLRALGYEARSCSQEHSDVPYMWQRIVPTDRLIYLDAELSTVQARSPRSDWHRALPRQRRRLAHARQHCDLYLPTDHLTPEEVLYRVVEFIEQQTAGQAPEKPAGI